MRKKKWPVIFGSVVAALILIVTCMILYIVWFLPNIPIKEIRVESTPVRIERGK